MSLKVCKVDIVAYNLILIDTHLHNDYSWIEVIIVITSRDINVEYRFEKKTHLYVNRRGLHSSLKYIFVNKRIS